MSLIFVCIVLEFSSLRSQETKAILLLGNDALAIKNGICIEPENMENIENLSAKVRSV